MVFYGEEIIYNQKEFSFPAVVGDEYKWHRQRGETWTVVGGKFLFKIIFSTADTR